jgi:RES domain-containing protein
MREPVLIDHRHEPIYRVVRSGWADPLDASFSRSATDRRWNHAGFPALYCCCGEAVARAVALDVLRYAGIELEELQPQARPELTEIRWQGEVVDVTTPEGVTAAGLPSAYPRGVDRDRTRSLGESWHGRGRAGVVCRSASLSKLGFDAWHGDHRRWSEIALFVENALRPPKLVRRRTDLDWI